MKATVTQLDAGNLDAEWATLIDHTQANKSDFVLLPEMAFSEWFCVSNTVDDDIWQNGVKSHEIWMKRLTELNAKIVTGTAPRNLGDKRHNVAYVWTATTGIQWIHSKTYLPDEDGFWEATWYDRGKVDFQLMTVEDIAIGVMICTELWFMEHVRHYGQNGIHILLNPRSTPYPTNDKWLAGGRTASVIAGAYCLSSNHAGQVRDMKLGGGGWIIDPESVVLGVTSEDKPFVTVDIDLPYAESAKKKYPRYVDASNI